VASSAPGFRAIGGRDHQLYLFSLFKALYMKLVKASKYGRNISRFLLKN